MSRRFDAIILGAGQAGTPLAGRLSEAGMSVALVERHLLGGTCVNTGCKPTKTWVASAYAAHMARRAADFGVTIPGEVGIDFAKVRARAEKITVDSRASLRRWIDGMANCTLFFGHARFESPHRVRVADEVLEADRIFLNVGGRAMVPDMPGVQDVPFLTNSSMFKLDAVPRHLVVVGGSYIGLEFGQMFRRFGAEVTIVEKGPKLIGREDPEISDTVRDILEAEGIAVRTGAECIRFASAGPDVLVGVDCQDGSPEVLGSHVLLAVGRRPNTDDLGLAAAGVETDARGYIRVDEHLRTTAPGIWAMGDCNGRGAFTHTAYNDFEIVADNLLDGADRKVTDRIPAYALYTDPPLGRVGMGEAEAKKAGHHILVGRRPMTRVGRAVEKDESLGFMKVVVDKDSGRLLGGAILGTSGDEAIHGVLDLMVKQGTAKDLAHAVHIHPTISELLPTIAGELKPA
ncbi:FAD-containing oxidoreductase [Sphingomonas sp. TDK1]|uniref:FAD-containing oxidoreductase n=1 Tax=Sphingomonas sp. TDK1 TaxID=453247 RepID=UPI0007D8F94A|nr:FAD-containing oxidoreductase [Sphingomonas sp. TDK1]OAN61565.1 mercuric reductase [Sphingomonas sp. TDK1]